MKCTSSILLITLILPLIVLITFLMVPIDIQAATNTTEILVNISVVATISVSPDYMQWLQVAPGQNGSVEKITVENTGSTTFTSLYVSVDSYLNTSGGNPTGGDSSLKYLSGSFLQMTNTSWFSDDTWWFVNQMSWNESTYPEPTGASDGSLSWGYFHNASQRWLWELTNGSTNCNQGKDAGVLLGVVDTVDSVDLSSNVSGDFLTNDSTWSVWGFASGIFKNYCVAAHMDCNYIMAYKFDKNSSLPGATACNTTNLDASASMLNPGQKTYYWAKATVPKGVPAGSATNSTVTFTAS